MQQLDCCWGQAVSVHTLPGQFQDSCITIQSLEQTRVWDTSRTHLRPYILAQSLRSFGGALLFTPHVPEAQLASTGSQAFSITGPMLWNTLPVDILQAFLLLIFRQQLNIIFLC